MKTWIGSVSRFAVRLGQSSTSPADRSHESY